MIEKHIFLISFLFGISMVTSQSVINGDWNINACELYYNRANPLEPGEFWYERLCYSKSPCDWCGGPDDIIQTSLKYGSKAGSFNLTDNSYFDMTIAIMNYTYPFIYSLSKIEFAWGPDEFSKCNETTSYIEALWPPINIVYATPDNWVRINFTQTYNSPVTRTIIDDPLQLSQYATVWFRIHFEWNDATSNGLIQPAWLRFEGTGGTMNPTPKPTQSPTVVTFSPSQTPTQVSVDPSVSPTQNPTLPSANPTEQACVGEEKLNFEETLEILISNITVIPSNNTKIKGTQIAEFADQTVPSFVNDDTQQLYCTHLVSCYRSKISFINNSICNIICNGSLSCAYSSINIVSCNHVNILCNGEQSCESANISINNENISLQPNNSIIINCGLETSCTMLNVDILHNNNTTTTISCFEANSCDNIYIEVDEYKNSILKLYSYSSNVIFNNHFGLQNIEKTQQFVECNTKQRYIEWNETLNDNIIIDLIEKEYTNKIFPCTDVTVQCGQNKSVNTYSRYNCTMNYNIVPLNPITPSPNYAPCYWASVDELIEPLCLGQCITSPTEDPTAAPSTSPTIPTINPTNTPSASPTTPPTSSPTQPPSTAPTITPSTSPTLSPTLAPTLAPSFNPSIAPTLNPSISPTNNPSLSPTVNPTIAPTFSPTAAPTIDPTQAPTRNPTGSKYNFDSKIVITYILTLLNNDNIDFILNNTLTDAIENIESIIESHYFDIKYLNQYEFFQIQIKKINEISYKNEQEFIRKMNVIYDELKESMQLNAEIEFDYKDGIHLLSTSKDKVFYRSTTHSLREYFNNSVMNFTVYDPKQLEIIQDESSSSFGVTFWTLNGILFVCAMLALAAMIQNKYSMRVDSANWIAIILYGVQIYDVVSDLNLTTEIFFAINNEAAHERGKDREGITDTPKEWILLLSGWGSLICIILPYLMNIFSAIKIPALTKKFACTRAWFGKYRRIFIFLVVFSGGAYPSLAIVTSNLFGLEVFNAGLSKFELESLLKIRVQTTVLLENVPQLGIQIMYAYSISNISENTILAFCTSVASIIATVMVYCMNKDQKGAVHHVYYYLEIKKAKQMNNQEVEDVLSEKEKKKKKGIE
eukprot:508800_1